MTVWAQFGRATVRQHGLDGALHLSQALATLAHNPVTTGLQVHQVAFFQVNNLIGHTCQSHGIAGQEALATFFANTQNQRGARTCAHHAAGFILVHHADGVGAMQTSRCSLHGFKQIAAVEAVHQVCDDFGVGLAGKHIALGLQFGTQSFVVFNDAVVHQCHAGRRIGISHSRDARAMTEVRVGVTHCWLTMGGPASVGNTGQASHMLGLYLLHQLGHTVGGACTLQAQAQTIGIGCLHGNAAGVITTVFKTLQALNQNRNDIAMGNRSNNATHRCTPSVLICSACYA